MSRSLSLINLEWDEIEPQYANGLVLGYYVYYKVHGSSDEELRLSVSDRVIDITGLSGATDYALQVRYRMGCAGNFTPTVCKCIRANNCNYLILPTASCNIDFV